MDLLKSTSILLKLLPLIEASCVFKTERFRFIVFAAGEFALEIDVKVHGGSWDNVKTAFVDGWATQYAKENG